MAQSQDALIAVLDSVSGKIINMPPSDAAMVTTLFSTRYSFSGMDPRPGVPTFSLVNTIDGTTPRPIITGAKMGNQALASVITAGVQLGLWIDRTT